MEKIEGNWKTIYGGNHHIDEGFHIVTIENSIGGRFVTLAEYKDTQWKVQKDVPFSDYKVVAFLKDNVNNFVEHYSGPTNHFKKGDVIVWDEGWMVIGSFDYPSDIAARAAVGRCHNLIYDDFVPSRAENQHLADENELNDIKTQLVDYYKSKTNARDENISLEYLELCDLKSVNSELYQYIKEKIEE